MADCGCTKTQELKLDIERIGTVSAILTQPDNARACYVLAHGAGAGMRHASMDKIAEGLADRGIATFRFNFPYMENKQGRPDQPAVAHATIRAAVEEAARLCPGLKLVAGGKSFGGRMTSQAQSKAPLPDVKGLAFLGFPLHADKKPSTERAEHLAHVEIPDAVPARHARRARRSRPPQARRSRRSARRRRCMRSKAAIIPSRC